MEESGDRERSGGLTPGDPLGGDPSPPPEPPPLPEEPIGPPSMYDDPPPAEPLPPPPQAPPAGYPPPQAPPTTGQPPPAQQPPPPAYPPPPPPPGGWQPPTAAPGQPTAPPTTPQQFGWQPPPYTPPPPRPKGPHGQPVWDNGAECATWGSRVGAYLIDVLISLAVPLAIGIPLAASGSSGLEVVGAIIIVAALFVGFPLYSATIEARSGEHNGQTFGKQIIGIRVVRDNNEPIGLGFALLRELVVRWLLIGFIGGFFFFPPLLDLLWPLWDETNRALHDMVVSTHVVRAEPVAPAGPAGLPA